MSTPDQPILIANSNYHVGHQVAIFVAERTLVDRRLDVDAEIYIAGGWRYTPFLRWYGAKHVTDMSKLG